MSVNLPSHGTCKAHPEATPVRQPVYDNQGRVTEKYYEACSGCVQASDEFWQQMLRGTLRYGIDGRREG
jgi:hypothetical protein